MHMVQFAFFEVSVTGKIKKTTTKKMVPCDGSHGIIQKMCYESEYLNITNEDIQRIVKYLEFKANQILIKILMT